MGKLQACPAPFPIDNAVFDQECSFQYRIIKFPLIKFIFRQKVVCTKGTRAGPSLYHLITFLSCRLLKLSAQCFTGRWIQVEKLVGLHIGEIGISLVFIQHPFKIIGLFLQIVTAPIPGAWQPAALTGWLPAFISYCTVRISYTFHAFLLQQYNPFISVTTALTQNSCLFTYLFCIIS